MSTPESWRRLTPRERDIVFVISSTGESNKRIGARLGIEEKTVKMLLKSIFRKTKLTNRAQLALWGALSPYIQAERGAEV